MRYIYIILLYQLLCACNSNNASYRLCDKFKESVKVRGELFVDNITINYPSAIKCDDFNLIIFAEGSEFINVFDIKDGSKLASSGTKGRSTGEVISTGFSGFNEKDSLISVYDVTLKRLNYYKYSNLDTIKVDYVNFKSNEYKDHVFGMQCMNDGYIVGYSVYDSNDQFILFDEKFEFIKSFGDFPLRNVKNFKGTMTGYTASYDNYLAYVTIDFGYIALYKIFDNGDIVKEWDKYITVPLFTEDGGRIIFDDQNLDGFLNIKMTKKYIYCTYSGKTYNEAISQNDNSKPNEILVFDYNGNPIRKIIPNYPMFYFDVSKDDKHIYSYVEDQTGKIIKYTI